MKSYNIPDIEKSLKNYPVNLSEAIRAKKTVYRHLSPTLLAKNEKLSKLLDSEIYIKHENHNITGSFKIRGGLNLLYHLKDKGITHVITFSTGNHGLSVATSAMLNGIKATVVIPKNSAESKIKKIKETGATVIESGETFEEASMVVNEIIKETQAYYVHPADEPLLINGVGTEFLEIYDNLPDIDSIILPLGAGSEVAAAVTVFKTLNPKIKIYTVQAEKSPAAYLSWKFKKIIETKNETFAGGLATGKGYNLPFLIYKDNIEDFILLSEDEIYEGIALAAHYTQNLVEGAGGAALMAAIKLKDKLKNEKTVIQFSGCNATPEEILNAYNRKSFKYGLT